MEVLRDQTQVVELFNERSIVRVESGGRHGVERAVPVQDVAGNDRGDRRLVH